MGYFVRSEDVPIFLVYMVLGFCFVILLLHFEITAKSNNIAVNMELIDNLYQHAEDWQCLFL